MMMGGAGHRGDERGGPFALLGTSSAGPNSLFASEQWQTLVRNAGLETPKRRGQNRFPRGARVAEEEAARQPTLGTGRGALAARLGHGNLGRLGRIFLLQNAKWTARDAYANFQFAILSATAASHLFSIPPPR